MCKPYLGLINNINYKSPFIVKTSGRDTVVVYRISLDNRG
jgi:hypothetical protein